MLKRDAKPRRGGRSFIRRTAGDVVFDVINITVFTLFMIICIFPFYYLFINTISDNDLSARGLVTLFPRGIHFQNYAQVFKIRGIFNAALISLARTVLGSTLTVLASAFVGYLMSKDVPPALEDAAQIDGAGYLARFARVVLPVCVPILATISVFAAVGQWNSFQDTLYLITDSKLYTLQFILYRYMNEADALAAIIKSSESSEMLANLAVTQTSTSVKMTVSMIVVLPILLVYPYFQRYFVKGIMIGAVKG